MQVAAAHRDESVLVKVFGHRMHSPRVLKRAEGFEKMRSDRNSSDLDKSTAVVLRVGMRPQGVGAKSLGHHYVPGKNAPWQKVAEPETEVHDELTEAVVQGIRRRMRDEVRVSGCRCIDGITGTFSFEGLPCRGLLQNTAKRRSQSLTRVSRDSVDPVLCLYETVQRSCL